MDGHRVPLEVIEASAPIRICDNGGWTDTWFAGHGRVCNIAASPRVEVQVRARPLDDLAERVIVDVENFRERVTVEPGRVSDRHPLLGAVIDEVGLPDHLALEISVSSEAPPGSSTGTSAAVAVALIGALDALTPGRLTPHDISRLAHRIETDRLGSESGVQDQICAAFGGINDIVIDPYPHSVVTRLALADSTWVELERRMVLVYLGRTHVSSDEHDRVISALADDPKKVERSLDALRKAAVDARDALVAGDLPSFGQAMRENTVAQGHLAPGIVGEHAQAVMDVARAHGALGWKVNGAGGEGGSVTLLLADEDQRGVPCLESALSRVDPSFRVIPTALSRDGLRVRSSEP